MHPQQPPRKAKPRLDPDSETVLIGFKGPATLKRSLEECAGTLGIGYSQLLRATAQECVLKIKKLKDGFDKGNG